MLTLGVGFNSYMIAMVFADTRENVDEVISPRFLCLSGDNKLILTTIITTMKRSILFFVSIFLLLSFVMAEPVDSLRALQVAKQFIPQNSSSAKKVPKKGKAKEAANIVYTHKMPKSGRDAFYIVNVDDAFVLVSADDIAHQILGYSFDKGFPVNADGTVQLPPHIKGFFDDLAAQIEAAIEAEPNRAPSEEWSGERKIRRAPSNLPESVGPLLTTTWDQGQYYNALCPEDVNGPAGHVWTGCVATAMAQIIKYWSEPVHGRGVHSYESNYGILEVNFAESNYDFSNMPDALSGESTAEQVNAVAKLMYDCGVAVNMGYAASESEAFDQEARAGFINFFRFSPDLSFAEKAYFSNEEWDNLLRQNLAANHPVYYSGQGTGGHSFVCDGYKTDDYYHFNFGWGGFADGWFLTSAVTPNDREYNSSQSAIVGIVPDNTGNVILGQMQGTSTFVVDEPLEFYHLMGHNKYEGSNYNNPCNSTVTFIPADDSKQMVADILEFENQNIQIYDGTNTNNSLRSLYGSVENDLSPVVSSASAITLTYSGNMYDAGFKLNISQDNGFRMVSNIVTSVEATTVHLMWTENGTASQWQIEYSFKGFELGKGTVYNAITNTATFENLEKFTEYDFYIRSNYGNDQYGPWNKVTLMIEAPYWTDVVTTRPEGYTFDEKTNIIEISTAEGLAWFASVANGLNGMPHDEVQWSGKTVILVNDIDLSAYRWMPIKYGFCGGVFDGQGHSITGIYVNEDEEVGFFSNLSGIDTKIINLNIENGFFYSGYHAGGIAATLSMGSLYNCSVKGYIYGRYLAGGLAAKANDCEIINCYTNCDITGNLQSSGGWMGTGGLIGTLLGTNKHLKHTVIRNCYSMSTVQSPMLKGLLIGYMRDSYMYNCYSLKHDEDNLIGYKELSTAVDNSVFLANGNDWVLRDNIHFDDVTTTCLLDALNMGVEAINTRGLYTWTIGTSNNTPVFDELYNVVCENVSDVVARNVLNNGKQAIEVSWTENGTVKEWDIRYGIQSGMYEESCDTMYVVRVTSNPAVINGLSDNNGKSCIINVRPVCDATHHGGWSSNYLLNIDYPYWSDVVTTKPEGYITDENGNVTISDAEGLAWLISVVNGENGQESDNMAGRIITLVNDVDMSAYRWRPIGYFGGFIGAFEGVLEGMEHTITGLRINENSDYVGMFAILNNSTIKNLNIVNCVVTGNSYTGGLSGFAERSNILNCNIDALVTGIGEVGGILGAIRITSSINHCGFNGELSATRLCGGIVGSVNNNMGSNNGVSSEVTISNCWSKGSISVTDEMVGGLIGLDMHYCKLYNSYSMCDIVSGYKSGGLVGYCYGSEFGYYPILENCYYASMNDNTINGMLLGYVEYRTDISNCYALGNNTLFVGYPSEELKIQNVSGFSFVDSTAQLLNPVMVCDSTLYNLNDALNYWVQCSNDNLFYLWQQSTDAISYPVFGNQLVVSCQFPQVVVDTIWENGVRLKWNSIEDVQSWEIEYGLWCFERGSGNSVTINDTVLIINNLTLGEKYDVYIRSNCGDAHSKWIKTTIKTDKLYWKDIVTSQPEGWEEDENGDIFIFTPEALAWLITYSETNLWTEHTIHIMKDLDISRYKWTTFGRYYMQWNIEGHGHTISGLYIDDEQNEIAFIHTLYNAYIKDLFFDNSYVRGQAYAAIICHSNGGEIINCGVRGRVVGYQSLGGITSINSYGATISNTFSNCEIKINSYGADFGGFCSLNYGELKNCYSSSQMIVDSAYYVRCQYMGVFTGKDYSNNSSENIAYWQRNNSMFINGVAYGGDGYYAFEEEDSSFIVVNPPLINGSTHSDLVVALNAWVDANNSEGQYRHWVADTKNVNGGYPVFAPTYTLTYKVGDEKYKTNWLEAGVALSAVAEPTKDGYVFGGWSELPETMPNHDVEVTGTFYLYGDVNTDTKVNVVDVVDIARYVVDDPSENFREKLADLNKDLAVNIADAVVLVNHIAGDQNFVKAELPISSLNDFESCSLSLQYGEMNDLSLCLTGDADFTAFQFEVDVPEGMNISAMQINGLRKDGHQLLFNKVADNRYRVAALSLSNAVFKGNDGELLNISLEGTGLDDICIHDIHFITRNGTDVRFDNLYINGTETGIADIHHEGNRPVYDLQGRRRSTLQRGVNIVGGKKMIVR